MTVAPCIFGPMVWSFLHLLSFNYQYSETNKKEMLNFLMSLGSVLPCDECRVHYLQNINNNGMTLDKALESKESFSLWMYNLHNLVNRQTGKPKNTWPSFEKIKADYMPLVQGGTSCNPSSCNENSSNIYCKVEILQKNQAGLVCDNKDISMIVLGLLLVIMTCLCVYFYSKSSNGPRGKVKK